MPGEFEAEQAARKVREDLEHEAYKAAERVREAEAQAKAAREAVEAKQIADARAKEEAASAARRADGQDMDLLDHVMFAAGQVRTDMPHDTGDTIGQPAPPPAPPDPALVDKAVAAERAAGAARAESARIRQQINDLPPPEDIMSEMAEEEQQPPEFDDARFLGGPGCLRIIGAASAGLGALLLLFSIPLGPANTTGNLSGLASPSPTATPTATATATAPASPSPAPPAAVTGEALGLVDFNRTSGTCTTQFRAGFGVKADAGAFTLLQLGVNHESTGTVEPNGNWTATAEGQMYRGRILGNRIDGMYSDPNCDYDFAGWLTRPLVAGPPYGTVPGYFEFLDPTTNSGGLGLLGVPPGVMPHVIVASDGDLDVRAHLPITVILTVDGTEQWRFVIEGAPTSVCRDATGCSADAPGERQATWDNEATKVLVTATGSDGTLLAAHAPNGVPEGAAPTPSASPSAVASAVPSSAPSPGASIAPSTPPAQTGSGGPNLPLAATGVVLLTGGFGAFVLGSRRRRRRGQGRFGRRGPRRPPISAGGPVTTSSTSGHDARRDELESQARKLDEQAAALQRELDGRLAEERRSIDFGEAFKDTVNALGGQPGDGGPPTHWFQDTEAEIARLRAEADALRAQLKS